MIFPEEIYKEHLSLINNIKFTPREIEIIACILHGKNSKGIATFLSTEQKLLGERAVETHILNIRRKIGGNARGSIITFIEQSDKYLIIRTYYSKLLIEREFKKTLKDFQLLIKSFLESIHIQYYITLERDKLFINQLINALNYFTRNVITEAKTDLITLFESEDNEYNLTVFLVPSETIKILNKKHNYNSSLIENKKQFLKTSIFLFTTENPNYDVDKNMININYIDIDKEKNFYSLFFNLILKIFPNTNLNIPIARFDKFYKNINVKSTLLSNIKDKDYVQSFIKNSWRDNKKVFITILISVSLISVYTIKLVDYLDDNQNLSRIASTKKDNKEILTKYYEDLSVNNLSINQADKNYHIIQQFKEVVNQMTSTETSKFFELSELQSGELINVLYNLNAFSSYLLFKEHDAIKAENILQYSKDLVQQYVNHRSKLKVNFETLSEAEIFTELSIIKDLPEMYTLTLYFLGRSLIYQKKSNLAEKLLKLAQFLGSKTMLFEEVLSIRSGLIIKEDQIDNEINQQNYSSAQNNLKECIKLYEKIIDNNNEYKLNYKPGNSSISLIAPKKDIINIIDCYKRIIKLYIKLIRISNNNDNKEYLASLSNLILGNRSLLEIMNFQKNSNKILPRIKADLYNNIGNLMLTLFDKKLSYKKLLVGIAHKLDITENRELKIIYQIFDLAKSLSRNTEFSKADAFEGLIGVCERLLNFQNKNLEEKKELLLKISNYKKAKDIINTVLKRNTKN